MKPITREQAQGMRECDVCGTDPEHTKDEFLPNAHDIDSMGQHWKTDLVCQVCGHYASGANLEDALKSWNDGKFNHRLSYVLPEVKV